MRTRAASQRVTNLNVPPPPTPPFAGGQNNLAVSIAYARLEESWVLTRMDPDSEDPETTAKEVIRYFESFWYQVGNYQLLNTFARDDRCVIMPQYAIRRFVYNDAQGMDFLVARVPDFCVAKLHLRKSEVRQRVTIMSSRIILLMEMKRSARSQAQFKVLAQDAWVQALEQAQFVFATDGSQDAVGAMISVGRAWGF